MLICLVVVVSSSSFCRVQVPRSWVELTYSFMDLVVSGTQFATLDEVRAMAEEARVGSGSGSSSVERELRLLLKYLTILGVVAWFDDPGLDSLVVLVRCGLVQSLLCFCLTSVAIHSLCCFCCLVVCRTHTGQSTRSPR